MTDELLTCSRCGRTRRAKFLTSRKNYKGKRVIRCRQKSVCHSKAKRTNAQYRKSVTRFSKKKG